MLSHNKRNALRIFRENPIDYGFGRVPTKAKKLKKKGKFGINRYEISWRKDKRYKR